MWNFQIWDKDVKKTLNPNVPNIGAASPDPSKHALGFSPKLYSTPDGLWVTALVSLASSVCLEVPLIRLMDKILHYPL